jgi:hypothetical protein
MSLKSTQTLAAALQEFLAQHVSEDGSRVTPLAPNAF